MTPVRRGGATRGGRGRTRGKQAQQAHGGRPHAAEAIPLPGYLRRLGVTPRKALGQHFLIDEMLLGDIADACLIEPDDIVLEVGAGPGGLTEELLTRARRVVAVEIDEELSALTRSRLADREGLCVVAADVLDFTPSELLLECGEQASPGGYIATGNLPYYITQPVVRRLLEADPAPRRVVVLVQREVARRIVGGPGRESFLSMRTRCFGTAELVLDIPSNAFWPEPKVQSALIRIERPDAPVVGVPTEQLPRFFNLLHAGFSEPRKQLHNALRNSLALSREQAMALLAAADIDPAARAQHLSLPDWERLYRLVAREHADTLDAG